MTSSTSRRSARATPKMAAEPVSSGTPPESIEPESENTSGEFTTWVLQMQDSSLVKAKIPGNNGRATLATGTRGESEARIYPNQTSKNYLASVRSVHSLWRADVEMEIVVPAPSAKAYAAKYPISADEGSVPFSDEHLKKLAASIVDNAFGEGEMEEVPF